MIFLCYSTSIPLPCVQANEANTKLRTITGEKGGVLQNKGDVVVSDLALAFSLPLLVVFYSGTTKL